MAAYDGFNLVWSNAMRFAIVGGVGEIIMFLGKILISVGTAFGFYCLVTYVSAIAETIFEPILLLIVIILFYLRLSSSSPMQSQPSSWQSTVSQWIPCWHVSLLTRLINKEREERLHYMPRRSWQNLLIEINENENNLFSRSSIL